MVDGIQTDRLLTSGQGFAAFGIREDLLTYGFSAEEGQGFGIRSNHVRSKEEWCAEGSTAVASQGIDSLQVYFDHPATEPPAGLDTLGFVTTRAFRLHGGGDSIPVLRGLGARRFSNVHLHISDSAFVSVGGEALKPIESVARPYSADLRRMGDSSHLNVAAVQQPSALAVVVEGYPEHAVIAGTDYSPLKRIAQEPRLPVAGLLLGWATVFAALLGLVPVGYGR